MSSLKKLKSFNKPLLREEVYSSVKEAILTGEIAPGEKLSISRLIKDTGISPTPIREAFLKLEQEGFVGRVLPKGGFIVLQLSTKDIEEIFDLRCLLESHAVTLSFEYITEKDIAELEKNVELSEQYILQKKFEKVSKLNTEFHDLLLGLCKHQKLISIINDLRDQIFQYRSIILRVPGRAKLSIQHHRRMIEALKKKNAKKLQSLTRQHIMKGKEIILTEIEKGNVKTIMV
jgi:DNA-binding GntR family transcriptional regulator